MSKIKRIILKLLHLPEFYLILGLALVLSVLRFGSAGVENVRLMRNGSTYETNFPIAVGMNNGERFTVEMDWFPGILGATKLKIHPDDCADALFVNGQPLDVEKYPGHCDWTNGFVIPSSDLESSGFGRKALRFELHNGVALRVCSSPLKWKVHWV